MGPFGLLEPLTLWTGVGLCGLVLLLGLVLVPSQFRRGNLVRGWLAQILVLLLLPALVVVTVFVGINRSTLMFTSWDDLLGGGGGGQVTADTVGAADGTHAGGGQASGAQASGSGDGGAGGDGSASATSGAGAPAGSSGPALTSRQQHPLQNPALAGLTDSTDGQWVTEQIPGPASGVTQNALVHLPAGYLRDPSRRYPVILAFSGIPGAPEAYRDVFKLDQVIDGLHQAGTMSEAIIVVPDVYPGSKDTECVDGTDGTGRYETWVVQDVMGWIGANLRMIPADQGGVATFGYSAGGWCASMISVRHPDLASVSISMAGYFTPWYAKGQQRRPEGDPEYDLARIMREQKPAVQMYFFSGGGDTEARRSAAGMARTIQEFGAPSGMQIEASSTGGHLIYLWVDQTAASLTWLAQHDRAFAPGT